MSTSAIHASLRSTFAAGLRQLFLSLALSLALPAVPPLAAQLTPATRRWERQDVEFKLDWNVVAAGQAVFVLGDLPELGGGDLLRAVRLVTTDRRRWHVRISLPVDRDYVYRYWLRSAGRLDLGDPANGAPITSELRGKTVRTVQGPGSKRFQVHTTLVDPLLRWRQDQGEFQLEPLEWIGPGRTPTELRYGCRSFALGRRAVELYLTSFDGTARDPVDESQTYVTPLDAFFLQDGELFTYVPAASVSPMQRAYSTPLTIYSSVLGRERNYRVMLPRGYEEHLDRRYPVLYQYDGKHMWDEIAPGYGIWDRDGTRMAGLVASGEVGELIQVAIDYLDDPICFNVNRAEDCVSPEDTVDLGFVCGRVRGKAQLFVSFLVAELKPHIDATYRTLPDRQHTFATGYSFGGVFALYAGWEFTDRFSAIAAQSGSFWIPNFPARVVTEERPDLRIYVDTGDLGEESGIFGPTMLLRNLFLLREGRVLERDLRFEMGFDQQHGFSSGGRRMRSMLTFLWPASREVASLPWP